MTIDVPAPCTLKFLALRRPDMCGCGQTLATGERAAWDKRRRVVVCLPCATGESLAAAQHPPETATPEAPPIDAGVAGASAQAEFERRRQKREERVRGAHPRIGGLLLALSDDPQSTRAWQTGGVGEQKAGQRFAELGEIVIALHDRRVPGSRANIDHIVVGPSGVFVVDTKRYAGATIELRRSGGFLSPYREQLIVRGRDQTKMVDAMEWQVSAVHTALADSPFADVSVRAVLCFVDGRLPFSGKIDIGEVRVRGPKTTARLVAEDGPLNASAREQLARHLAARLPAMKSPKASGN